MHELEQLIDAAWEDRANLKPGTAPAKIGEAVNHIIGELDSGALRVAEKINGEWVTHQWIKKAVLLSFRLEDNVLMDGGPMRYFDKVPNKFAASALLPSPIMAWKNEKFPLDTSALLSYCISDIYEGDRERWGRGRMNERRAPRRRRQTAIISPA